MTNAFYKGLSTPLIGLRILARDRRARVFVFVPLLIYAALFGGGLYQMRGLLSSWDASLNSWLSGWAEWLEWLGVLVYWISWLFAALMLLFFIYLIARIIAAPFLGWMAEHLLRQDDVIAGNPSGFAGWARVTGRMTLITIIESVVFLIVGIVLFLLSFVPGLAPVTGFLVLVILAYDSASYSFEVLGLSFRERLALVRKNLGFFTGLACAMGITLVIPILNFVLFPAAVAGAAKSMKRLTSQRE